MKNAVFCAVTTCGSFKYRRFGGTYIPIIRVAIIIKVGTTLGVSSNRSRL
jgi:hypothetical protein